MAVNGEQNQLDAANQNNQQNNNTTSAAPTTGGGASSSPSASGRTANFSNGVQQNSGSGRFTNLQNYINANQGATDRYYQGIGNKIEQTAKGKKDEANTQASAVREGIQSANNTLDRGQGYYNQMQGPAFNAQDFTADQDRLTDYSKFQNNQAVDTANLNNLNTNAQAAAMGVQDLYKNRAQQVGNEQGRFDLLKETYGQNNPNYSAGQQRLDNLFLQAGANGGKVNALQNDVRNQLNNATSNLESLTGQAANDITGITGNQTDLANNLKTLSNQNEQNFVQGLTDQIGDFNANRQADIANARKELAGLTARQTPGMVTTGDPVSDKFLSELGLTRGTRTYNAFGNGAVTDLEQLAQIGRDATSAQDLATQADADQYDALAKLAFAGIDPSGQYTQDTAKKQINGASTLDPAVQAILDNQGVSAAQNMINNAGGAFNDYAKNANLTGTGGAYTGDYGEISIGSTANANLADLLAGQGVSVANSQTNNRGRFGDLGKSAVDYYNLGGDINTAEDLRNRIATIAGANQLNGSGQQWNDTSKNYSVDADWNTRVNEGLAAGMTGGLGTAYTVDQADKYFRDLYNSDLGDQLGGLPGVGNVFNAIGGSLFGAKSRKNENLDQTAAYANYGKDDAYLGSGGSKTNLYQQALEQLSNRGYFDYL